MLSAMRMFKEIKIMVDSLVGSMHIFLWCTGLFLLLLALFAVFFVQGFNSYMESNNSAEMSEDLQTIIEYYGSVSSAMLSLFKAATSGDDWSIFYVRAKALGVQYEYLLLLFITFYNFAFFNVVVGVFCEKALNISKPTLNELLSERYQKEFDDARELQNLLINHLSRDVAMGSGELPMETELSLSRFQASGQIESEQFERFMEDPEVERFFEVRGVSPSSARRFFRLLCELHGSTSVDFPTFVSACVKLDGSASSIDIHVLSVRQLHGLFQMQGWQKLQHSEVKQNQQVLHQDLEQQISRLKEYLSQLSQATRAPIASSSPILQKENSTIATGKPVDLDELPPLSKRSDPFCADAPKILPIHQPAPQILPRSAGDMEVDPVGGLLSKSDVFEVVEDLTAKGVLSKSDVLEMQTILSTMNSSMGELKSVQSQMQKDLKSTIGNLERKSSIHQEKMETNTDDMARISAMAAQGDKAQRNAAEAQKRAAETALQLEAQQRLGHELQQQLSKQHQEHDRALSQVTEQSQMREHELKRLLQETSKRLEQTQMELQREIWRNEPQSNRVAPSWCVGTRGTCSGRGYDQQSNPPLTGRSGSDRGSERSSARNPASDSGILIGQPAAPLRAPEPLRQPPSTRTETSM
jgi:hypothetical protein